METKQIIMLILLLGTSVIGSATLVYVLWGLDKEDVPSDEEREQNPGGDHH